MAEESPQPNDIQTILNKDLFYSKICPSQITRWTKKGATTQDLLQLCVEMLVEADQHHDEAVLHFHRLEDGGYEVSVYER